MLKQLAAGLVSLIAISAAASAQSLEYRNSISLGNTGGFSDLSGITWIGDNHWRAVSDKRNDAPMLSIALNPLDGSITAASLAGKATIAGKILDYEGIAYARHRRSYFISEETTPGIHEVSQADLTQLARYPAPTPFGKIRPNRGLESLALNASGTRLYTANEEALRIDGHAATAAAPTNVRIIEYAVTGKTPGTGVVERHQYVYQVDSIGHADAAGTAHHGESGLSDIAVLPDGSLLMLERAVYYTQFLGHDVPHFRCRIYRVDLAGAMPLADPAKAITNPANRDTCSPVAKTLLYEGSPFNVEGLGIGPPTHNGLSILAVTDNQRDATGGLIQNQIYAFEYIPPAADPAG